jgi:short-subunit dehydrogenase
MFKDEYGRWCIILGGSEGVGAAFAREIAAKGLNVFLVARKLEPLTDLAWEIRLKNQSIEVRTLSVDLATADAAGRIKSATAELEVGLMIYNAGAETSFGNLLDHDWEFLHGRLMRNFFVLTELVHHFGRKMRARKRGAIVLMGSFAGFFGSPGFALYAASKAFTHYLAEGIWYELKQDNVDLLCPVLGPTDTPAMMKAWGPMAGPKTDPAYVAEGALTRLKEGPVWVVDDISPQIDALLVMQPAERAVMAAHLAIDFTKQHKHAPPAHDS